ncbi:hypothetical protein HPB49_015109 [Dermacentor silvarum]|uniref:Uncharacterized protein n=1 Tax=Dermacentor silvarum TaxID=543639 RepID=A0ACB8DPY6_DERSI|nr:hypothetical protein HPB49_015109 [Dermacentor silvarum]
MPPLRSTKKSNLKAWLDFLLDTPLYRYYRFSVDCAKLDAIPNHNEQEEGEQEEEIKTATQVDDPYDPAQCAKAMHAVSQTVLYNNAVGVDAGGAFLEVPDEGQVPISLLYDEHAEELVFPQIYLGQRRKITSAHATPFAKASSETADRMVIATVCVRPASSKRDVEDVMNDLV